MTHLEVIEVNVRRSRSLKTQAMPEEAGRSRMTWQRR